MDYSPSPGIGFIQAIQTGGDRLMFSNTCLRSFTFLCLPTGIQWQWSVLDFI